MEYINKQTVSINRDFESITYLKWYDKDAIENFPLMSLDTNNRGQVDVIATNKSGFKFSNLKDYLLFGQSKGLTHLVLDNNNSDNHYLKHIFNNEDDYPFLIKIFDSKDLGYTYHLKIYEINYEKFIHEWEQ